MPLTDGEKPKLRILVASGLETSAMYAHVLNTIKMAQGFARLGCDVTLVCWAPFSGPVPVDELALQIATHIGGK